MKTPTTVSIEIDAFSTREKCLQYLCDLKWCNGFKCRRCAHNISIKGKMWYYKKCQLCKYEESCTAHTMFHKLKFPLTTAFALIYQLSTLRKGMSCNQISKVYKIHVVSSWFFRAKVQVAMSEKSPRNFSEYMKRCVDMRKSCSSKYLQLQIECKTKGKLKTKIAKLITGIERGKPRKWGKERWSAMRGKNYRPRKSKRCLEIDLNFLNGDQQDKTQMFILNMRNWLSGTHHFVSMLYLERYMIEFQYRYESRKKPFSENFKNLINRMMNVGYCQLSSLKAN